MRMMVWCKGLLSIITGHLHRQELIYQEGLLPLSLPHSAFLDSLFTTLPLSLLIGIQEVNFAAMDFCDRQWRTLRNDGRKFTEGLPKTYIKCMKSTYAWPVYVYVSCVEPSLKVNQFYNLLHILHLPVTKKFWWLKLNQTTSLKDLICLMFISKLYFESHTGCCPFISADLTMETWCQRGYAAS